MSERYLTAADLAADLKRVIDEQPPQPIHARGDRAQGAEAVRRYEDARFFLALLPGPRRGDGMPESVRFWKDRVEAVDGQQRSSASACSMALPAVASRRFVRAGLLPHLDRGRVRPIYVEATPSGTEARLLAELRSEVPALPADVNLPGAVRKPPRRHSSIRPAAKLFLVLDQFEQWLQSHPENPDAELVRALRHCDGRHVQALLVVRDDFWMAVTRFLQAVDVPLVQAGNAAAVELFDARHTRKVLEAFGRALGQLPEARESVTEEAEQFLEEVASGLTDVDGRTIPMRLSLFTRGGEEPSLDSSNPARTGGCRWYRREVPGRLLHEARVPALRRGGEEGAQYAVAASDVGDSREALLRQRAPVGGGLRGPAGRVCRADAGAHRTNCGWSPWPRQTARRPARTRRSPAGETRYQLAHDFLVRPIRRWLEREQGSTPRGRARLRLKLVTASWLERPGSRRLPSILEWAGILRHLPPGEWSTDERRLMVAATRHYVTRGVAALAVLAAVALGVESIRERDRARNVLAQAIEAEPGILRGLLPEIAAHRGRFRPDLERVEGDNSAGIRQKANAVLLLHREQPTAERAASATQPG